MTRIIRVLLLILVIHNGLNSQSIIPYLSYIDSIIIAEMEEYNVPGAVLTIVHNSTDIFYKGYGMANLENNVEVDAVRTGFRVASITKTFTALAAMQLVEQGILDMNEDIRVYLPEYKYSFLEKGRITMHQLLTHTAGFEMTDIHDAAMVADDVASLEDVVRKYMPYQAYPPGEVYCYSNFGYSLAGYIIEQVSGKNYVKYINEHILSPLDMKFSGLEQPLVNPVKNNEASSYLWKGEQIKYIRDFTNVVPADALVTTGKDMGNYMLMHLNKGKYQGQQILSEDHHKMLTSRQYGGEATTFGICYSFFEGNWTGRRSLEHSGGQLGFASVLILIPETGTGIFVAHNSREGANRFRYDVIGPVLDTMLGQKETEFSTITDPKNYDTTLDSYTGTYRQMNYPKKSFEKIGLLFDVISSEWEVKKAHDSLTIFGNRFEPLGNNIFYALDNPAWRVGFETSNTGGKAHLMTSGLNSYERISWYQRTVFLQLMLGLGLLILFVMFMARLIRSLVNSLRRKHKTYQRSWIYEWMYYTGSAFIISFLVIILNFSIYGGQLNDYGIPFTIKSSLMLNTLAGISSLFSVIALWKVSSSVNYTWKRKSFYLLGIGGLMITAVGYWYLNLMNF